MGSIPGRYHVQVRQLSSSRVPHPAGARLRASYELTVGSPHGAWIAILSTMEKLNRPIIALVCFLIGVLATNAQNPARSEGATPYTPTRLEWLAVDLQSLMGLDITTNPEGYGITFASSSAEENTILIYVTYLPTVRRELMNGDLEEARKFIASYATAKGWSSWLKVKENIKMLEPPK